MTHNVLKELGALVALSLILSLVACAAPGDAVEPLAALPTATPEPAATTEPPATAEPVATAKPSLDALGDVTYQGIFEEPITLTDGTYEGAPFVEGETSRPTVTLLPELTTAGDLDGDGQADSVVLLAANSGGSGTFVYLAVVEFEDRRPVNVATTLLGDRVQVQAVSIEDGQIVVTLITHGPDDPLCCPTQEETLTFQVQDGELVEVTPG